MFPMYNYCQYFIYGLTCNYLLVSIKCQVDSSLLPKMHWCAIHHINSNTVALVCGIILTKGHPTGADHQEERYHGSSSIDPTVYRRQINPTLDLWAAILNAVIYPCLSASLRNGVSSTKRSIPGVVRLYWIYFMWRHRWQNVNQLRLWIDSGPWALFCDIFMEQFFVLLETPYTPEKWLNWPNTSER